MTTDSLARDSDVAVVTGGGGGIGRAVAEELARLGFHVVVADVDGDLAQATAASVTCAGRHRASATAVDVADAESMRDLAATAGRCGTVSAWVNVAGISLRSAITDMAVTDFDRVLAINARSTFLGIQAAAGLMQNGGAIVNVSSICARQAMEGTAAYGASKAAIESLTVHAAHELGERGIRVNAIAPGTIRTAMTEQRLSQPSEREWTRRRVPMRRPGEAREVAMLVGFLATPDSSYLNGAVIPCDGGWSASA